MEFNIRERYLVKKTKKQEKIFNLVINRLAWILFGTVLGYFWAFKALT